MSAFCTWLAVYVGHLSKVPCEVSLVVKVQDAGRALFNYSRIEKPLRLATVVAGIGLEPGLGLHQWGKSERKLIIQKIKRKLTAIST